MIKVFLSRLVHTQRSNRNTFPPPLQSGLMFPSMFILRMQRKVQHSLIGKVSRFPLQYKYIEFHEVLFYLRLHMSDWNSTSTTHILQEKKEHTNSWETRRLLRQNESWIRKQDLFLADQNWRNTNFRHTEMCFRVLQISNKFQRQKPLVGEGVTLIC